MLANPRTGVASNARMPLSIVHLTAVLEGRWPWSIVDGNRHVDPVTSTLRLLGARPHALVGLTVVAALLVATPALAQTAPAIWPAVALTRRR